MSFIEKRQRRIQSIKNKITSYYSNLTNIENTLVSNKNHLIYKCNICNDLGLSKNSERFNIDNVLSNDVISFYENLYNYLFMLYTKNNIIFDDRSLKKKTFILAIKAKMVVESDDIYKFDRLYDSLSDKLDDSLIYMTDINVINVRNVFVDILNKQLEQDKTLL